MKLTLKHYKLCGLSAPQIGVPLRIILVDFSENTLLEFSPEIRRSREMTSCPLTIIINPSVEVINSKKVVFTEGCQSLSGFSASVPRYYEVKISGRLYLPSIILFFAFLSTAPDLFPFCF